MVEELSPKECLKLIESDDAILIDVREADEFMNSHIPYAMSIPMSLIDGMFHHLNFSADKAIIFQCKMGGRSKRVCDYVTTIPDMKDRRIINMAGGIQTWNDEGLIVIA